MVAVKKSIKKVITCEKLIDKIRKYNPNCDIDKITKAYYFCKEGHGKQKRKSGELYYHHPIAVAEKIISMNLDDDTIVTALLHDLVEDTEITLEDIEENFSLEIAGLVKGVTKLDKIKFQPNHIAQAENFRKLFLALSKDIRVILVKLCDRWHNMQSVCFHKPAKARRIATETLEIFTPLAGRFGIYNLKNELQDLSFNVINPIARASVLKRIRVLKNKYKEILNNQDIILVIKRNLTSLLKKKGMKDFIVEGREKQPFSIWKKLIENDIEFDQLHDFMAFKVITNSIPECYNVLGIIHENYHSVPMTFKDYNSTPKENGYKSIHTTIFGLFGQKIEIQIKTKEMDHNAQYGLASHWSYKYSSILKNKDISENIWINRVLEILQRSSSAEEFLNATKMEMYNKQIFIFNEHGGLIILPSQATVLDFAFALNEENAVYCNGGMINGKISSIKARLKNGDQVKLITSKHVKPEISWLDFCITAKAQSVIKAIINNDDHKKIVAKGRKVLEKVLSEHNIVLNEDIIKKIKKIDNKKIDLLCFDIANDKIALQNVVTKIINHLTNFSDKKKELLLLSNNSNQLGSCYKVDVNLISGVAKNLKISISNCCNPIVNEEICGLVVPNYGIFVHRKDCSNLNNKLLKPSQILGLSWDRKAL